MTSQPATNSGRPTPRSYAHIQYPFADAGAFAANDITHDAVLVTQDPHPTLAFYRDTLIGFLKNGGPWWVGRREWAEGDMHEFYARLGIRKQDQLEIDDFWEAYRNEMTHPAILLDLAARQARESLDGL